MPNKVVLASGNPGKLREFAAVLGGGTQDIVPQSQFGVPEADESGLSFVENAILKARNAAHHTGLPALADDSGIEVDALNGVPGIYSARYAGPGASDADNLRKLLGVVSDVPDAARTARFQCVIVYLRHAADPTPLICQGTWEGYLTRAARGEHGFGYDPIFYVPSHRCTSAELSPEIKNVLSHRGQALRRLQMHWDQLRLVIPQNESA